MELVTNRLERLQPGTVLALRASVIPPAAVADPSRERRIPDALAVVSARPHGGRFRVAFEGVGDIDAAESLRGAVLLAEPLEDPDALFVHDLIGSEVVDVDGRSHGRVQAVEANPASDILVLDGGALVPLVFVVRHGEGRVVVDPPDGLLE